MSFLFLLMTRGGKIPAFEGEVHGISHHSSEKGEARVFLTEVEREFRAVRAQVPPGGFEGKPEVFRVRLTAQQDREVAPGNRGIEFGLLEQVLERVLGELEGKRLAELEVFDRKPPSLENLAQFIYRKAEILLERGGGKVDEVGIEPSEGRRVRYRKTTSERPAIRF